MTKDERFLVELYKRLDGKLESTTDPDSLASDLGYSLRQTKTVLKGLFQANLVKKYASDEIGLTSRGIEVAQSLFIIGK